MLDTTRFYIDGRWRAPQGAEQLGVFNPATEEEIARISLGSAADVDRAAQAARRAFTSYAETGREERLGYLRGIVDGFRRRLPVRWKDQPRHEVHHLGHPGEGGIGPTLCTGRRSVARAGGHHVRWDNSASTASASA